MKKIVGFGFLIGSLALTSQLFALPNGKPFQELRDTIEANTDAIQANADAISELDSRLTAVESELVNIKVQVSDLGSRITTNTEDINSLLNSTDGLQSDLTVLIEKHSSDFNAITAEIEEIKAEVAALEEKLDTCKEDLQAQLDNHDSNLESLESGLAALDANLSAQTSFLATQINGLSSDINNAQVMIEDLYGSQDDLADAIEGLKLRAAALEGRMSTTEGRVTVLEGFHTVIPQPCDSGVEQGKNGTSFDWVVCEADENSAWVSHGPNWEQSGHGNGYHAEKICQSLGYTTVSRWGGTCGNVCGYCQGSTSCSDPGMKQFYSSWDNNNCGSDAEGKMICRTVSWECVK